MPAPSPCFHLVDDDARFLDSAARCMGVSGLAALTCLSPQAFLDNCDPLRPGCLVTEARLSGLELASQLGRLPCPLPVVMVAADADVPLAVAAIASTS